MKFSKLSLNFVGKWDSLTSFLTLLGYIKEISANKSIYVTNVSKVCTLNLSCLDQQSIGIPLELPVTSSKGFQIISHLVSINISGIVNVVNENSARYLAKTFKNNLQLEELFMNKCEITTQILEVFCLQLQHISLRSFEIMGNCIDDKAIEKLAITILHWDSLENIKLTENNISAQCMLLIKLLTENGEPLSIVNLANSHCVIKVSCHVRFSLYLIQVTDYYCKNVQFIQSILINAL